jgi:hypothetical protein
MTHFRGNKAASELKPKSSQEKAATLKETFSISAIKLTSLDSSSNFPSSNYLCAFLRKRDLTCDNINFL